MLKIGLTGGIGSGKTAVSNIFEKSNVPVIDTDIIAHELVDNNTEVLQEISHAFGQDMLTLDGKLNRKKLAQLVFKVKKNKQRLEEILHPKIKQQVLIQLQNLSTNQNPPHYCIIVVPLLIETDYQEFIDRILVVTADESTRVERVRQRDKRSVDEIRSIIANQVDDNFRLQAADDIIENNSTIKNLGAQINILDEKYRQLFTKNA